MAAYEHNESDGFGLPNLTQMIEVLLVVIFTLLVSLGDDVGVDLPNIGYGEPDENYKPVPTIIVAARADGTLQLDGAAMSLDQVIARIRDLGKTQGATMQLDADESVVYKLFGPLIFEATRAKVQIALSREKGN